MNLYYPENHLSFICWPGSSLMGAFVLDVWEGVIFGIKRTEGRGNTFIMFLKEIRKGDCGGESSFNNIKNSLSGIPMKKCPYCAEKIQKEAIKCKHCGEWLIKKNSDLIVANIKSEEKKIVFKINSLPINENTINRAELEKLKKRYTSWSTEDLINAATVEKNDYYPEAIELMFEELNVRNISQQEIDSLKYEFEKKKQCESKKLEGIGGFLERVANTYSKHEDFRSNELTEIAKSVLEKILKLGVVSDEMRLKANKEIRETNSPPKKEEDLFDWQMFWELSFNTLRWIFLPGNFRITIPCWTNRSYLKKLIKTGYFEKFASVIFEKAKREDWAGSLNDPELREATKKFFLECMVKEANNYLISDDPYLDKRANIKTPRNLSEKVMKSLSLSTPVGLY